MNSRIELNSVLVMRFKRCNGMSQESHFSEVWMNKQNTNDKKEIPNTKCLLAQGPWEVHLLVSAKSLYSNPVALWWHSFIVVSWISLKDQIVSKQHRGLTVIFILVRKFSWLKVAFFKFQEPCLKKIFPEAIKWQNASSALKHYSA